MTIQIPDDLAHGLEHPAAAQSKTVEQLAVENLRGLFDGETSPQAFVRRIRALPHPSIEAVDDMEAAIEAGRLPVRNEGIFDGDSEV